MNASTNHALGIYHSLQLGTVLDTADPDGRGRIKFKLLGNEIEMWAPVVAASAGDGYGTVLLPKVDETVVIAFVQPEFPLVLGAIWAGSSSAPTDADPVADHYLIQSPQGLIIELDDAEGPKINLRTPAGYFIEIDDGGTSVTISKGGDEIKLDSEGISITAASKVKVDAGQVEVSAGMFKVDAGMSKFSGVVQADTVIANSVVSSSYTPGAGNIW